MSIIIDKVVVLVYVFFCRGWRKKMRLKILGLLLVSFVLGNLADSAYAASFEDRVGDFLDS
ncbi:MAG: hypothetical protein HC932_02785, partial [Thermales bacterium]|nr:hypothetical protein [Thermales bacterium]